MNSFFFIPNSASTWTKVNDVKTEIITKPFEYICSIGDFAKAVFKPIKNQMKTETGK